MKHLLFFVFIIISNTSFANSNEHKFLDSEKNTIEVFQNSVDSVVNVSNIQVYQTFWDMESRESASGAGSGFVWDKKGHIVTNFHVVQGGQKFKISFANDEKEYDATLVGGEPNKDIAVLKIENPPKNLSPIKVGNSQNLIVGQKAVAIGNPFGLDSTLTTGVISALGRKMKGYGNVTILGMIQTDASINPGNSGGPLLNSSGELIGINTMIYSSTNSSAGIGFAVPVNTIKNVVPQLIQYGKTIRPGLGFVPLNDYFKRRLRIKRGIAIGDLIEGSPADKAGLKKTKLYRNGRYDLGDVIVKVGDYKIDSFDDIYHALENYKVGEKVEVTYIRNGKKKRTKIKLMQLP